MRYVITHGHIFKNAGSTVDTALKNAFGKDFLDHRDDKSMRQGGSEYLAQYILDNPNIKAISSHHLCNPLPVSEEFTCIPIYFVRNPIERIISVYNFERIQARGSAGAEKAANLGLIDYVKWRLQPGSPNVFLNYQTAYMGAGRYLRPDESVNISMLLNAHDLITDQNTFTGTVEQFDKSFEKLSHHLKRYFPDKSFIFKRKNTHNSASSEEKFQNAIEKLKPVLADVLKENALDILLHKAVSEKLNEQ